MNTKLLTKHNLEHLSLKGGCRGSSESTLIKMLHCWKYHVATQLCFPFLTEFRREGFYAQKKCRTRLDATERNILLGSPLLSG